MDLEKYSRRRKIGFVTLILAVGTGLVFHGKLASGVAFMAGTQNLDVKEQRFEPGESGEKFWVQESYEAEIENLSEREYYVTQKNGTEPPFRNEYYDNKRKGIYVDVVSGEPLFSSKHKFDSGTGWPSFYRPLEPGNIVERKDPGPLGVRTEIASKNAGSHLGHLFKNPDTPTGLRYCMNSAALEFIPAENLEEKGYGKYADSFNLEE